MLILLMNNWLYEVKRDGERRLAWQEVDKISHGFGYYLKENFLAFLSLKHPAARFRVDDSYRVTSRISSWG